VTGGENNSFCLFETISPGAFGFRDLRIAHREGFCRTALVAVRNGIMLFAGAHSFAKWCASVGLAHSDQEAAVHEL
jgi:hypothetical protein